MKQWQASWCIQQSPGCSRTLIRESGVIITTFHFIRIGVYKVQLGHMCCCCCVRAAGSNPSLEHRLLEPLEQAQQKVGRAHRQRATAKQHGAASAIPGVFPGNDRCYCAHLDCTATAAEVERTSSQIAASLVAGDVWKWCSWWLYWCVGTAKCTPAIGVAVGAGHVHLWSKS